MKQWSDKRYHTWNWHLRQVFGEKVAKISLDAGFSCPNRDRQGRGGCIYCSPRGSGDCAGDVTLPLSAQYEQIKVRVLGKWPQTRKYIAYFQAYTNTHGPADQLAELYTDALALPQVVGLSVSTRPDCLPPPVLDVLSDINQKTWLWVELGLQTVHNQTLQTINRGHDYASFCAAVEQLSARNIKICAHLILGLPGEDREMMLMSARALASLPIQGVKLHMLHVLKNTALARMWQRGQVPLLSLHQYVRTLVDILELLPEEMVVHRLTGDAPGDILLAPLWIRRKWEVLQAIDREFASRNSWQGKKFSTLPAQGDGHYVT